MKICKNCGVKVDTTEKFCPLCYGNLESVKEDEPSKFFVDKKSEVIVSKKRKKAIKILLFLNIIALSVLIFINIKSQTEPWSLVVGLSCLYVWLTVEHSIISHDTPFKKAFMQVLALSVTLFAINKIYSTNDWITNYVFPSLAMATLLFTSIYALFDKQRKTKIFSFFLLSVVLIIVSAIFLIFNIDTFRTLNQLNIILQGLVCFAYILFAGKKILTEAIKKFHI